MEELFSNLSIQLERLKHDKVILEQIKQTMLGHGILRGETQRIFMGEIEVKDLDRRTLVLLSEEVYKSSGDINSNPYGYFSMKDISSVKEDKGSVTTIEVAKFPIVIQNAFKQNDETYIALIDAKEIVKLYISNLLQYNYSITKQYKFSKDIVGDLSRTVDINMKEVKGIAEKIIDRKYTIDKIILNVLVGSGKGKETELTDNVLTIFESRVDIISGLHEISALALALEHSDIEMKIQVEIKHYNLNDITSFFNKLNLKGGVN